LVIKRKRKKAAKKYAEIYARTIHECCGNDLNNAYRNLLAFKKNELSKDDYKHVITKHPYIDIFEHYDIHKFAKAICDLDVSVLGKMHKHTIFVRVYNMSKNDTCHDTLLRIKGGDSNEFSKDERNPSS